MTATPITLHIRTAAGQSRTLTAKPGLSLMRAAVDADVQEIAADCGGCLTCATCHVFIDEAWLDRLPPRSADESAMLEMTAAPMRATSRLSCQIKLDASLDGLQFETPLQQY